MVGYFDHMRHAAYNLTACDLGGFAVLAISQVAASAVGIVIHAGDCLPLLFKVGHIGRSRFPALVAVLGQHLANFAIRRFASGCPLAHGLDGCWIARPCLGCGRCTLIAENVDRACDGVADRVAQDERRIVAGVNSGQVAVDAAHAFKNDVHLSTVELAQLSCKLLVANDLDANRAAIDINHDLVVLQRTHE